MQSSLDRCDVSAWRALAACPRRNFPLRPTAEMICARGVAAQNRLPLLWTFRGATGVVCGALHREGAKPT